MLIGKMITAGRASPLPAIGRDGAELFLILEDYATRSYIFCMQYLQRLSGAISIESLT